VQNLVTIWQNLGLKRQIIVAGATLAMFLAILSLARSAAAPQMALLYSGLDRAAAGEVIAALEQAGVPYEIAGDAISVDGAMRDSLRMTLAAEGLPANSGTGYELLDGLSGFGTTSQMFDAAYWRAKEGELARTILSNPAIRAARVHIAQGANQPFTPDGTPSASVTVTASGGMSPDQAKAVRHLVAAAVLNLRPEDVEVVDSLRGLMPNMESEISSGLAASSRAEEIKRNVERLLSARVGPGKAVVEVSVDLVTERETLTEQRIDPQERVAISTETTENTGTSQGANGGAVTVASNLPEGAGGASGAGPQSESNETRERVNYEVSQSQREVVRLPGDVRKLSVAVIVDGVDVLAVDGTLTKEPRSEEELTALRELVSSAVGLDTARGDVLTLKALDFLPSGTEGTLLEAGLLAGMGPIDVMQLIQLAVLSLIALVLGLFVLRPILMSRRPAIGAQAALAGMAGTLALPGAIDAQGNPVLTGVIDDDANALSLANGDSEAAQDPMERLRRLIEERQAESIEILRGWMEQNEEPV
jgi:flagellar M-ring protein FliF